MVPRKGQSAWDALKEAQASRVIEREEQRIATAKRRKAEDEALRKRVKAQVQKNVSPYQRLLDLFRKKKDNRDGFDA
jgi:hypothetical protein